MESSTSRQNEDSLALGHHKGPRAVNKLTKPKPPQGGICQRRHWKLCWKACQVLRQQSVGSQSCCCSSAGSHPSFDPLGLAVCVRCWTALHWLTFGMLICAALSAFSVVSSRYCVAFMELSKPSGIFQTRDTYCFFHLFHCKDMDF